LAKRVLALLGLILVLSATAIGGQQRGTTSVGVRLGLFKNSHNDIDRVNSDVKLFASKTIFYIEGYVNYYLLDFLALSANLGSYSKGDIRFDVYYNGVLDGSFIGQASVYPMQLGLKFSPFSNQLPLNCRPFLEGGGALIVGRETATMGSYGSVFGRYSDGNIGTETDFNWWGAIGTEIPLSPTIQMDFMVKYVKTNFSGDIAGIKDYSGVQISIGIGYVKPHKKAGVRHNGDKNSY
jgi:hypothetical protein